MKRLLSIMMLFAFTLACVLPASTQTAPDNYLKMKGKILDGHTADITVFQLTDSENWIPIRTMKSRKNYTLKLNPESNYYVIFDSGEGLNKVLYVDAGSTGMWIMQLDINFDQRHIKYARMYQTKSKDYTLKTVNKAGTKIIIGKDAYASSEDLSEHEGK